MKKLIVETALPCSVSVYDLQLFQIYSHTCLYLLKSDVSRSTTASTSSARREWKNAKIALSNDKLILQEHFHSLTSFKEKILNESLPSGYICCGYKI